MRTGFARNGLAKCKASMGPRSCERGNDTGGRVGIGDEFDASMGPRSCERGNEPVSPNPMRIVRLLQWGRARASAEILRPRSAATPRNSLQWGRARASAEIRRPLQRGERAVVASMGPRSCERGNGGDGKMPLQASPWLQWGRARASAEMHRCGTRALSPRSRFNGAALVRARKSG